LHVFTHWKLPILTEVLTKQSPSNGLTGSPQLVSGKLATPNCHMTYTYVHSTTNIVLSPAHVMILLCWEQGDTAE